MGAEGLAHRPVPIAGRTRGSVTMLESALERRIRFVIPGPAVTSDEPDAVLELCRTGDVARLVRDM